MEMYFTLDAANRSLALVRPIVEDILGKMKDAQVLHDDVRSKKTLAGLNEISLLEKLSKAERLLNEVEYHMKELESVGVFLKDLKIGTVDFPTLHEGRVIYLCWAIGEKSIQHWHETDRGFADRKVIDESFSTLKVA